MDIHLLWLLKKKNRKQVQECGYERQGLLPKDACVCVPQGDHVMCCVTSDRWPLDAIQ